MSDQSLSAVPIFAAGHWQGKRYTTDDLDAIVANHARNQKTFPVPAVLGHGESQDLLKSAGLPAAAWAHRLYRRGKQLFADFVDMPAKVVNLLKSKAYRKVSAEIYDAPPPGTSGAGRMLRRVAFLGADIPVIKTLDDIPLIQLHSEDDSPMPRVHPDIVHKLDEGVYACFSETGCMNREQMLNALADEGIDLSQVTDAVPDAFLAEICRLVDSLHESTESAGKEKEEEGSKEESKPDEPRKSDKEDSNNPPDRYSEGQSVTTAEIEAIVEKALQKGLSGHVEGQIATLRKFAEEQHASTKKSMIDAFIDSRLKEGKILPAEIDSANPASLRDRLYRADSRQVVCKFSEGGKDIDLTELDLQMREIDSRACFRFGEQVRSGPQASTSEEVEVQKIEAHYEQFAEGFRKVGLKKAELVEGFKAARKRKPELTCDQFIAA